MNEAGTGIPTTEEDFLPLSGLQHFVYCQRQCALIHVEGVFAENHATVEGRLLHEPDDTPGHRLRDDVDVERSVWLRSEKLGVIGRADRVEVARSAGGVTQLFPVESKRSRRRSLVADTVQLCAQAVALEEMKGIPIPRGALYYIRSRRRLVVEFTHDLRGRTLAAAVAYHDLIRRQMVPAAHLDGRCRLCSLRDICVPAVTARPEALSGFLSRLASGEVGDAS